MEVAPLFYNDAVSGIGPDTALPFCIPTQEPTSVDSLSVTGSRVRFAGKLSSPAPVETSYTRHPFRVCCCARHHPLAHTRRLHCLAQPTVRPEGRSPTWGTLPDCGF